MARPKVSVVPLWLLTAREVTDAVLAVSDVLIDIEGTAHSMRVRARQAATTPAAAWWGLGFLFDTQGGAGWCGWLPWEETPNAWQSTTYLAPRLRGQGLLSVLRCDQVHRAQALTRRWELVNPVFVSSIHEENVRSLAASRRYAQTQGWVEWESRFEKVLRRPAQVLTWPVGMPHDCYLG